MSLHELDDLGYLLVVQCNAQVKDSSVSRGHDVFTASQNDLGSFSVVHVDSGNDGCPIDLKIS